MDLHDTLSVVACTVHLAFAVLVWRQRSASPVAPRLTLLFLDLCGWNFADLAYTLSGDETWHQVDRAFASFTPALVFHVVAAFVGRARALGPILGGTYVVSLGLAFVQSNVHWWQLLLGWALLVTLCSAALLVRHRRASVDSVERARTSMIFAALVIGTALGSTDLWFQEAPLPVPRLGNLGTLFAALVLAAATLRLRLLGREVGLLAPISTLAIGVACVAPAVALLRWFDADTALLVLAGFTAVAVGVAAVREGGRAALLARERARRHAQLGRFAEQLAHDLRNPLAAVKGALQFLAAEREAGRSLDAQSNYLALMLEQVERIQRSIDDYQRLAKVEAALVLGSLNDVVRNVLALQQVASSSGIETRTEIDAALPSCRLDRELLEAALHNLIGNAREAMPDGGAITVRTAHDVEAAEVVLTVEDRGHGMDVRELERAADEFFTTKARGTGLGLHFVKRVAEAHGGRLELQSQLGQGTTVRLALPLPN